MQKGAILVLSGPSGAGKSTIINAAEDEIGEYYFSISTTTRAPREGEQHGREYFFVSKEEFEEDIKAGNFLEYAKVHGNYYGTSLKPVREALEVGKLVIFDIDVQGHRLVRAKMNDITTSAFITPPTLKELEQGCAREVLTMMRLSSSVSKMPKRRSPRSWSMILRSLMMTSHRQPSSL